MHKFTQWAAKEHSLARRLLAVIPAGFLFVLLIPFILLSVAPSIDRALGFPPLSLGVPGLIAGVVLIAIGLFYGLWSNAGIFEARGTPLPMLPSQELVITPPFDQCRNPMTFGTILLYLGASTLAGSITAYGIVVLLAALLVSYLKLVEERELEARFGEDYLAYKSRTPFIIPRIPKKGSF